MKYHKQTIMHDPQNGQYGDCFRTALACIFDLEIMEVPHFFNRKFENFDEAWEQVTEWLAKRGYLLLTIAFKGELQEVLNSMKYHNPGVRYFLAGSSKRGNHQVIAFEDRIEHDPHPENSGLEGPCPDGYFWVNFFLPMYIHG